MPKSSKPDRATAATVKKVKRTVKVKKKEKQPPALRKDGRRKKVRLTPEEKAEVRQKEQMVLELRMAGTPYHEIARAVGYSGPGSAKKAFDRAVNNLTLDAAKETIIMDIASIDEFRMRATHALRQNGDLGQIDRILRLMEFKYRLLGVNDETVRAIQADHGILNGSGNVTVNNKNQVQIIAAAPETQEEFIAKMMNAVGVDPDSSEAKELLRQYNVNEDGSVVRALPMLEGSANSDRDALVGKEELEAADIVDAEIVE